MMRRLNPLTCLLRPLALLPRGPTHAPYAAALALIAIQVGIGIILKASQKPGGSYAFSPSASVTISEFLKLVLSSIFFYNECRRRAANGIRPSTRGREDSTYMTLSASEPSSTRRNSLEEKEIEEGFKESEAHQSGSRQKSSPSPLLDALTYWSYVRGEVTLDVQYGFCKLALLYVLINNLVRRLRSCRAHRNKLILP